MTKVLDIFLQYLDEIDSVIICKCDMISKEIREIIQNKNIWSKAFYSKTQPIQSNYYNNTEILVTATDAKNKMYLSNIDLDQITHLDKFHKSYKKYYKLFRKDDLFQFLIFKHRGAYNLISFISTKKEKKLQRLLAIETKKQQKIDIRNGREASFNQILLEKHLQIPHYDYHIKNIIEDYFDSKRNDLDIIINMIDIKNKRRKHIENILIENDLLYDDDKYTYEQFVNGIIFNGELENAIRRNIEYKNKRDLLLTKLEENNLNYNDNLYMCREYMYSTRNDIDNFITDLITHQKYKNNKKNRERMLSQKLKEKGLSLRNDSFVCKEYITGNRDDIDNVVTIMMQMQYFMTKTNYQNIMKNTIYRYKYQLIYEDHHRDDENIEELVQKHIPVLSEEAKFKALQDKNIENIPEYCRKYKR